MKLILFADKQTNHLTLKIITMKKIILTTAIFILAGIAPAMAQHSDTLHPVADAYIVTMGGGEAKTLL